MYQVWKGGLDRNILRLKTMLKNGEKAYGHRVPLSPRGNLKSYKIAVWSSNNVRWQAIWITILSRVNCSQYQPMS